MFKIFKMFKSYMKFTRAAYWINSKMNNRDKNTTLTISGEILSTKYYHCFIIEIEFSRVW